MSNKVRAFSKCFLAAVLPFFLILILFSCNNLFTDDTKNKTPKNQPEENKIVTITGSFVSPYAEAGQNSRSALPSFSYSDYSETNYYVEAKETGVTDKEVSGTVNLDNRTFSVPLSLGKSWTITLGVKNDDGDSVLKAEFSFGHALTQTDVTTPLALVLQPIMTPETGRGDVSLSFSFPSSITKVGIIGFSGETEEVLTIANSSASINKTSIQSKVYTVSINFYKDNVLVYSTAQEINVFDNMTTNRWVSSSTQNSPITTAGAFELTSGDIADFKYTNFFVASATSTPAGNDSNDGSPYYPLASVGEALRHITVVGNGESYTIWLMSGITENISMTNALNGKASAITIKSAPGVSATIDGNQSGRVFDIATTVPVTFESLTITGGSVAGNGGGLNIGTGAGVTLRNCSVMENSVTGSSSLGGGIYNGGELRVKDRLNVTDNTDGSGAASNLYLPAEKTVTVTGALSEGSSIGITTGTEPAFNTPVTFTSGFGPSNSGITPSGIFTSDKGYVVMSGTGSSEGEVVLGASGGNLGDAFDYAVALLCTNTEIASGSALAVTAAVTKGVASNQVTVDTTADDITWNFEILSYGDHVATIPASSITPAAGSARVAILPSVNIIKGVTYTLHATATYKGIAYDKEFELAGSNLNFVSVPGATISSTISGSAVFNGRTLTIPNMYVSNHEVTRSEYAAVMGTGSGEGTVKEVSWFDALEYCNKKSIADGLTPCYAVNGETDPSKWNHEAPPSDLATHRDYIVGLITCNFGADGYRLPTEAEWEYIARGGNGLTGTNESDFMNVALWEWCWDHYSENIPSNTPATGAVFDSDSNVWRRPTTRYGSNLSRRSWTPGTPSIYVGFRVVCTAQNIYIGSKIPYETKAVGDIVFYDGSATPYTSELTLTDAQKNAAIAVIFYVGTGLNNADDTTTVRTLGVGLQQSENELAWTAGNAANMNISTVNPSDKNGSDNLEQIGQFLDQNGSTDDTGDASKYPAFYYAKNYKNVAGSHVAGTMYESGWYLPSHSELTQVYNAKTTVNAAIALCGGKQFGSDSADPWYRTSTQHNTAATNCYQINFSNGNTTNYNKKYTYTKPGDYYYGYASAIREF